MNLATRIYKQFGQESIKVVRENPYKLAQDIHGIGFRTADEIAVKLGLPRDSIPRIATGLKYVLAQAANDDGHCYLPENELVYRASELLQAPSELLSIALEQLRGERDERLAVAEEEIAAVDESIVEIRDHDFLGDIVEIDDDVAAEDDVEMAEERDARFVVEIQAAEGDAVADFVFDLE